jgi:hypothetical protein
MHESNALHVPKECLRLFHKYCWHLLVCQEVHLRQGVTRHSEPLLSRFQLYAAQQNDIFL